VLKLLLKNILASSSASSPHYLKLNIFGAETTINTLTNTLAASGVIPPIQLNNPFLNQVPPEERARAPVRYRQHRKHSPCPDGVTQEHVKKIYVDFLLYIRPRYSMTTHFSPSLSPLPPLSLSNDYIFLGISYPTNPRD